jgi:hypothetical protein
MLLACTNPCHDHLLDGAFKLTVWWRLVMKGTVKLELYDNFSKQFVWLAKLLGCRASATKAELGLKYMYGLPRSRIRADICMNAKSTELFRGVRVKSKYGLGPNEHPRYTSDRPGQDVSRIVSHSAKRGLVLGSNGIDSPDYDVHYTTCIRAFLFMTDRV